SLHGRVAGQCHGGGGGQRNTLVGGAEQHVERHARIQQRLGIELRQPADRCAAIEKACIEEVGAGAAGLHLETAEAQHALVEGKTDKVGGSGSSGGHAAEFREYG